MAARKVSKKVRRNKSTGSRDTFVRSAFRIAVRTSAIIGYFSREKKMFPGQLIDMIIEEKLGQAFDLKSNATDRARVMRIGKAIADQPSQSISPETEEKVHALSSGLKVALGKKNG